MGGGGGGVGTIICGRTPPVSTNGTLGGFLIGLYRKTFLFFWVGALNPPLTTLFYITISYTKCDLCDQMVYIVSTVIAIYLYYNLDSP